jgi:hypothetical protein
MFPTVGFPPIYGSVLDEQRFLNPTNIQASSGSASTIVSGVWIKPPGARRTRIILVGSGGGAGGGQTRVAGTAGGGGGGGGSAAGVVFELDSIFLPSRILVIIGRGGLGGAADLPGAQGGVTGLANEMFDPSGATFATSGWLETITGGAAGGAGSGGTGGSGGSGGTSGGFGVIGGLAGRGSANIGWSATTGGNGGSAAVGQSGSNTSSSPIWSGSGGGGCTVGGTSNLGGGSATNCPFPPQVFASNVVGGVGTNGPDQLFYGFDHGLGFVLGPPAGGNGNATAGTAGSGGNGIYGTGGAGGGAGVTGGRGGNGGGGFAIFTSW